jgi:ribonuclease-3
MNQPQSTMHGGESVEETLTRCESRIGYRFVDRDLLYSALTHSSGASSRVQSNERLEFLGDAILGMVVCHKLYESYPDLLEGELTRIKSVVVSRETCAKASESLQLEDCLFLGKGMTAQSSIPKSLLSDVFESLVAAIHLDGGFEAAREFIEAHLFRFIQPVADGDAGGNYKSELQHYAQRTYGRTPTYAMLDSQGPDHEKSFQISACIGDQTFSPAWGRSKKVAEQNAAMNALRELGELAE